MAALALLGGTVIGGVSFVAAPLSSWVEVGAYTLWFVVTVVSCIYRHPAIGASGCLLTYCAVAILAGGSDEGGRLSGLGLSYGLLCFGAHRSESV